MAATIAQLDNAALAATIAASRRMRSIAATATLARQAKSARVMRRAVWRKTPSIAGIIFAMPVLNAAAAISASNGTRLIAAVATRAAPE